MNYNSATKNEIKLFAGKGNGTGDYHEENIPSRHPMSSLILKI
jgi:hypothetical protein